MDLRFDQVDNRLDAISSALEANNKARRACQFNANLPANAGVNFQPVPLTSLTPGNMPNGLMQRSEERRRCLLGLDRTGLLELGTFRNILDARITKSSLGRESS
eukprot:Opistho-2@56856